MKPIFVSFLLIGFALITSPTVAQQSSVDTVITSIYESISFTADKDPDYEAFKNFFIDNGQLISVSDTSSYTLTPEDYEQMMQKQRQSGAVIAFTEEELYRKTETYGSIKHVFSTYKTYLETPDGTETARGINSIQLLKKNGEWKIVSLIWYEENKTHPLPAMYLPK
jgi:hypothetical protein